MDADNTEGKGATAGCSPYIIGPPTWTCFLTLKTGSFEAQWASLGCCRIGNVTEMNVLQILSPTNWHLPSAFTRIKSCAAAATNLQHPLKGVQVEIRNEVLCALGKTVRTGLQRVRYFQEKIL